ncbi:MAG: hypothetical protein JWO59_3440 [Chloroflexi bacterium]|nr:hypothetical protein [Chloroflexota bacterium]
MPAENTTPNAIGLNEEKNEKTASSIFADSKALYPL